MVVQNNKGLWYLITLICEIFGASFIPDTDAGTSGKSILLS
jgi:hypothetical protein